MPDMVANGCTNARAASTHTPTTARARLFGIAAGYRQSCFHFGVPLRGVEAFGDIPLKGNQSDY
jgi:hypothetical protein